MSFQEDYTYTVQYYSTFADGIIDSFKHERQSVNVNSMIKLELIRRYVADSISYKKTNIKSVEQEYKKLTSIKYYLSSYFQMINATNLEGILGKLETVYERLFWELFASYHVEERIPPRVFLRLLRSESIQMIEVMYYPTLVYYYNDAFLTYMQENIDVYMNLYLYHSHKPLYLPSGLTSERHNYWMNKYVMGYAHELEHLIDLMKKSRILRLSSDMIDNLEEMIEEKINAHFIENDDAYSLTETYIDAVKGDHDQRYFMSHIDPFSVIENLIKIFKITQEDGSITLASDYYPIHHYDFKEIKMDGMTTKLLRDHVDEHLESLKEYILFLEDQNHPIEEVIDLFFNRYLRTYQCNLFNFPPLKGEDMSVRVSHLFKMIQTIPSIYRTLCHVTRESMLCDGQVENKYIYPGNDFKVLTYCLYDEKSIINNEDDPDFVTLMNRKPLYYQDFSTLEHTYISILYDVGIIEIAMNGKMSFNEEKMSIIEDIYYKGWSINKNQNELDLLKDYEYISFGTSLFSEVEESFLVHLLKSHSIYEANYTRQDDYVMLLYIILVMMIKIDQEFKMIQSH